MPDPDQVRRVQGSATDTFFSHREGKTGAFLRAAIPGSKPGKDPGPDDQGARFGTMR